MSICSLTVISVAPKIQDLTQRICNRAESRRDLINKSVTQGKQDLRWQDLTDTYWEIAGDLSEVCAICKNIYWLQLRPSKCGL